MTRKKKRLAVILGALTFLAGATTLTLYALGQKTSYFYMPSDLTAGAVEPGQRIRLGGLVEAGTIARGQGVVTEGTFDAGGTFMADSVLAKHDENYMPREVADGLKAKGVWQEEER